MTKDYNADIQRLFLEMMMEDIGVYTLEDRKTPRLKIELIRKHLYA